MNTEAIQSKWHGRIEWVVFSELFLRHIWITEVKAELFVLILGKI